MIAAQRVRVAAFQMLYGLDAHAAPEQPPEALLETLRASVLEESEDLAARELRRVLRHMLRQANAVELRLGQSIGLVSGQLQHMA